MRAVILVGGFGTRLRPLTFTTPKQLLPVLDKPMIERKIAQLVEHGVDDIVFSMGYRPDAFKDAFPDGKCAGAQITYVVENEPLGTAGAIAFAARGAGIDETFLAMNGDTLTDLDVDALVRLHRERAAEATITLTPVEDPSRFGVVPTDPDGRVQAFIEKPKREEAPTNLINAGTYVLEPSFLDRVGPGENVSIERQIFPNIAESGGLFAGHFSRYWLDIGTPESYLQGNLDAIDSDCGGASFVGVGAEVANDATHERSVIGAGATVGSGARIVESVLLPGAKVEAGAVIERSIVGEHATVGAGASLVNLTVVGGNAQVEPDTKLNDAKVEAS